MVLSENELLKEICAKFYEDRIKRISFTTSTGRTQNFGLFIWGSERHCITGDIRQIAIYGRAIPGKFDSRVVGFEAKATNGRSIRVGDLNESYENDRYRVPENGRFTIVRGWAGADVDRLVIYGVNY